MRQLSVWAIGLCLLPADALAHSAMPGIDGFYTGLFHPFTTAGQVMVLLAAGLLVGQYKVKRYQLFGAVFAAATLAGMILGGPTTDDETWLYAIAVAGATMAALMPGRAAALALPVVLAAGLLLGKVSVPDPGPSQERLVTMFGSFMGANGGLLYAGGLVSVLRERVTAEWQAIAFRVAAAWVATIALLMLALAFAPPA